MADYAYPTVAHNNRVVSPREYEDLASPQAPDGVIGSPLQATVVFADSSLLGVKIRANQSVLIRGLRWESGSTERSVPLDPNTTPGTTRKDLIVLRMTRNPWEATPAVIKGAPAAQPVTPSPTYGESTGTGVWELPLAEVTVPYNDSVTDAAQCRNLAWYVGKDGQLLCTSGARPPYEPGRRWFETDTGREVLSTGTGLIVVGDDSGNLSLPLVKTNGAATGWSATVNNLRRRNGGVFLQISPQRAPGGNILANTDVDLGTLGAAFRPPFVVEGVVTSSVTGGRITVNPGTGLVQVSLFNGLQAGRFIICQPLSYPAA